MPAAVLVPEESIEDLIAAYRTKLWAAQKARARYDALKKETDAAWVATETATKYLNHANTRLQQKLSNSPLAPPIDDDKAP